MELLLSRFLGALLGRLLGLLGGFLRCHVLFSFTVKL